MKKILFMILLIVSFVSIFYNDMTFLNPFDLNESFHLIIYELRMPRVLLAAFIGAGLANIGWTYQIHFKNELATPYTLGISSVAALSLALSELLATSALSLNKDIVFFILVSPLVYLFFKAKTKNFRGKILLLGMGVGILSSSLIVLAQTLMGNESVARLIHWTMGSLNVVGINEIKIVIPIIVLSLIYSFKNKSKLALISIGDDFALSRGVNADKIFAKDLLVSSVALCSMIWIAGPIGFVGMLIPQISKRVWSANYSRAMLNCTLLGAIFLVVCDFISRNLLAQIQLPIGAITAVIGAPTLIYFILKSRY